MEFSIANGNDYTTHFYKDRWLQRGLSDLFGNGWACQGWQERIADWVKTNKRIENHHFLGRLRVGIHNKIMMALGSVWANWVCFEPEPACWWCENDVST